MTTWFLAILGGAMIGAASGLLLLTHGRIAGISGITASAFDATDDRGWRLAFLAGLAAAGVAARVLAPAAIGGAVRSMPVVIIAGLVVGFGTRLGGGCTSGHGICGVARLSVRSIAATAIFMLTAIATVAVTRHVLGG